MNKKKETREKEGGEQSTNETKKEQLTLFP